MSSSNTSFDVVSHGQLEAMSPDERDALDFGLIGLDGDGRAVIYNKTEEQLSGVDRDRVIGSDFFSSIGQCMNNFLVAQRFEDEDDLDETLPFVLTLRMRPTKVTLRLLASSGSERDYILVNRRS